MKRIITVTREFGSGGRELAKRLAEKTGYKYYDKQVIGDLISNFGGGKELINNEEQAENYDFPYLISRSFSFYPTYQKQATEQLVLEQKVIKELAEKGDCIFVGMGSDLILREFNPFNIFVYADLNSKIQRCRQKGESGENLTDREIKRQIKNIDRARQRHYLLLGSDDWGKKENYHLCINTSNLVIKSLLPALEGFINTFFEENE